MNEKTESPTLEPVETTQTEEPIQVETPVGHESKEKISQENAEQTQAESKTSKGILAKVAVGGVMLASLLGAAYYYAQHHNVFDLGRIFHTDESLSSEAGQADDNGMTQAPLPVDTVEGDSVSTPELVGQDAMPQPSERHSENTPLTDTSADAVAEVLSDSPPNAPLVDMPTLEADAPVKDPAVTAVTPMAQDSPSARSVLNGLLGLYQVADFERTVRIHKENTLKALKAIKGHLVGQADGSLWDSVRQAVDKDIEALSAVEALNLEALFKVTVELTELAKTAPFVSAESAPDNEAVSVNTPQTDHSMATSEGSWLDKVMNYLAHLPRQLYEAVRSDLGGLVRVEKLSNPAVSTLSVSDIQAQRAETLRQLSIAQEALLKREEAAWKAATKAVEQQFMIYYNRNDGKTQQAIDWVHRLMDTSVKTNLPALSHTQHALEQLDRQLPIEH